jgi:hypothetical protein
MISFFRAEQCWDYRVARAPDTHDSSRRNYAAGSENFLIHSYYNTHMLLASNGALARIRESRRGKASTRDLLRMLAQTCQELD